MFTVLFVCTGNTCRSPMAQAAANEFFAKNGLDCKAISCGLAAGMSGMSPNAAAALKERYGKDFSHRAEQLSEELIKKSDMIVGISRHHAESVRELYPYSLKGKILVSMPRDIPDPFGGDLEVYRKCLDEIVRGVEELFEHVMREKQEESDVRVELFDASMARDLFEIEKLCFSTPWCENEFERLDANEFATTFVAYKDEKIVGFTVIYRIADEAQIMDLAVHPNRRRMGVAQALVDVAIDYCRVDGAAKIMLEVRESNVAARALYEKKGFKTVGERKDYYALPTENAVLYDLEL